MKRLCSVLVLVAMLTACENGSDEMERAMGIRSRILKAESCDFEAEITADYGDKVQRFSVSCKGDERGDLSFTVMSPEEISGISGTIKENLGNLSFGDRALSFPLLTDDQLSPVSAPWIFLQTLRSGYITSVGKEEDLLRVTIHDTYEEDALQLDVWLNEQDIPVRSEMLYDGRRILSLDVRNFSVM